MKADAAGPLRILVMEDAEDDYATLSFELGRELPGCLTRWVQDAGAMYAAIDEWQPHAVLTDVQVPRYDVFAALGRIRAQWPHLPVVVVSGQVGEEVAARLIRAGANDFVAKSGVGRLARVIERELAEARERAEKAELARRLRWQERLIERVLEHLPVGVWMLDPAGEVIRGNPAGRAIWEGPPYVDLAGERAGKAWWADTQQCIAPADWGAARALRDGETTLDERVEIEIAGGEHKVLLHSAVPLRDDAGEPAGCFVVNQDITAQHRAEQRLRRTERTLRGLSRRLVDAQERERRWIAQELHDDIGQAIAAMRFQLARIVDQADPATARELAAAALHSSDQLNTRLRQICLGLRPLELDDFGLMAALRSLVASLGERPGLAILLEGGAAELRYPSAVETAAYRIAQESINNALRHSGCRSLGVRVQMQAERLEISVTDNGCGFVVGEAASAGMRADHLGLVGMAEHAHSVGGELDIVSAPGGGTSIVATLPGAGLGATGKTDSQAVLT